LLLKDGTSIHSEAIIERFSNESVYTWEMFLNNGMELHLDICVDFTYSNLPADHPQSLHYTGANKPTYYELAMKTVVEILMQTTANRLNHLIGLYGFGAKVRMPNLNTDRFDHHCFPLNDNTSLPYVNGLQNALLTYKNSIKFLEFGSNKFLYFRADFIRAILGICHRACKKNYP
jgi:hypothetical protein